MRKAKLVVLAVTILAMLASCSWLTQLTTTSAMETVVISYESLAYVVFPSVKTYIKTREANGSLAGDALVKAKADYTRARKLYKSAGDSLVTVLGDAPPPATFQTFQEALNQVAVILANLSGGKVEGNKITIPKN